MTINELMRLISAALPDSQIDQDTDGQVIIYTSLWLTSNMDNDSTLLTIDDLQADEPSPE